jgi:hypothetical protein
MLMDLRVRAQLETSGYPDSMTLDRSEWEHGRSAWQRLDGWDQEGPTAGRHPDDGDSALRALADVGTVRRLLDGAELAAVRTARRHRKSWAEIATRLGVSRQSAWERWRDLDESGRDESGADKSGTGEAGAREAGPNLLSSEARERRRLSTAFVPAVIGLSVPDALDALRRAGLVGVGPDDARRSALAASDGVVVDQSPEPGARVEAGSSVRLWVRGSGGSGVREPRRPSPQPRAGRAMREEPTEPSASGRAR